MSHRNWFDIVVQAWTSQQKCVRPQYNNKEVRRRKAHILGQLKATTKVMPQNSREELA